MRKYFITGFVILLPLALTLAIVFFIFNFLTEPFVGVVKTILGYYGLFDEGFLFLSADHVQKYISQLIILTLLFFFTVGLGFLARWFFIHYLIRFWEYVLNHIPFISSLYKVCRDITETIFHSKTNSFKQVVLVPYPSSQAQAIGFVTGETVVGTEAQASPLVAVFMPTTPNPTSGFLMLFKSDEVVYLDMSVEEALKYVISCGVIPAPFSPISKDRSPLNIKKDLAS